VRPDDQEIFRNLDDDIVNENRRQPAAQEVPGPTAVRRDIDGQIRPQVEAVLVGRVFLDFVGDPSGNSGRDVDPSRAEILRFIEIGFEKESLNARKQFKDLSSSCRVENGKIVIRGEEEAVTAVYEGAGEPVVDYVKFKSVREYALSADGTILTLSMNFDTPQGPQSMTLVFNRAKAS